MNVERKYQSNLYLIEGIKSKRSNYKSINHRLLNRKGETANFDKYEIKGNNNINNSELEGFILEVKEELHMLKNQISAVYEIGPTREGDENGMEQLRDKINDIDKKVAILEERTKILSDLPTRDEMKNIVLDSLENKNLATRSDVELQVLKSRNTQILWTIGTVIAAVGVLVRFF